MTLIISCVAREAALLVSDRRLTMPDGSLFDDNANKAVCLWCRNAHVAFAYTGLARIGGRATDLWLVDNLLEIGAPSLSLQEVGVELQDRLTAAMRSLHNTVTNRNLTLVFTGCIEHVEPFWGAISNEMGPAGENLGTPLDEFRRFRMPSSELTKRKAFLSVSGEPRAVPTGLDKRIRKKQRQFSAQPPARTAKELASAIRIASDDPRYGAYIGKECTAVIVWPDGRFTAHAYTKPGSPTIFMPQIVGPVGAVQDLKMTRKPRNLTGETEQGG